MAFPHPALGKWRIGSRRDSPPHSHGRAARPKPERLAGYWGTVGRSGVVTARKEFGAKCWNSAGNRW